MILDEQQGRALMGARSLRAGILVIVLMTPIAGSLVMPASQGSEDGYIAEGWSLDVPSQYSLQTPDAPWWERTSLDSDRNGIHDSLQEGEDKSWVGLSYGRDLNPDDIDTIHAMGIESAIHIPAVDALLLGEINSSAIATLALLDGVVMVEEYGVLQFYGDIQTPATKSSSSEIYPKGAWELGVSGQGVNIALTDTGVDSEHPGLVGKHVAGYDAVCFVHSDPMCILSGGRQSDGSFDPDDANQHGTACMGMAAATGVGPNGEQTDFYGSAPNATLIDVRIGTDVGAGPFENYLIEQEFYESAMNGIQWIIDNKDTPWPGVDESLYGIDIISLSWGITSHEGGGSDGEDMHSRILDEATLAGITVSVAAGNDGPDNDGLSGMGSSSLSVTVGATDDQNTINRDDDTIAGYSSRGPRRDNGDSNPVNELKPDVTAPGSNIIQAEGCVSSGGCNNNIPGQDASSNDYTGRGSGTSYATPAVTGVISLMIEANPNLHPLAIREVLKQTAERRGEPTFPEIDPYWNKDFGWGMVDARAAVEMAIHLEDTSQSESIEWTLQAHALNSTETGSKTIIQGHSWAIEGNVERVEYRLDTGDWYEVIYEDVEGEVAALQPFNWTLEINRKTLDETNHTLEIRAASGSGTSIPILLTIEGLGAESESNLLGIAISALSSILLLSLVAVVARRVLSKRNLDESEIMDAEIVG
tara:strand:+ start:1631 stop:3733 length:2103 start_codon:yes stop_codon:yes gene_type:complete